MLTRPVSKMRNRETLTQAVKCEVATQSHSARFFFRQVCFQFVAQQEARENVQESVKDVLMKLFLISVRGCRCRELTHCVYESQQKLRGGSVGHKAAWDILPRCAFFIVWCIELVETSLCLLQTFKLSGRHEAVCSRSAFSLLFGPLA